MDKSYPSKIPMVVRSIDMEKDPFRPREEGKEILGSVYHISVLLVHSCILQIVPVQTLLLQ